MPDDEVDLFDFGFSFHDVEVLNEVLVGVGL